MIARRTLVRFAAVALPALVWAGMPLLHAADDAAPEKTKAAPQKKVEYRGPLPFHYAKVVSPDQKEKIYAIQERYEAEMQPLMAKIKELQAARDKEIDSILSPEQLKRLEEIRAEAKTKFVKKPAVEDKSPVEAK